MEKKFKSNSLNQKENSLPNVMEKWKGLGGLTGSISLSVPFPLYALSGLFSPRAGTKNLPAHILLIK